MVFFHGVCGPYHFLLDITEQINLLTPDGIWIENRCSWKHQVYQQRQKHFPKRRFLSKRTFGSSENVLNVTHFCQNLERRWRQVPFHAETNSWTRSKRSGFSSSLTSSTSTSMLASPASSWSMSQQLGGISFCLSPPTWLQCDLRRVILVVGWNSY